jgi:hypothetical protein
LYKNRLSECLSQKQPSFGVFELFSVGSFSQALFDVRVRRQINFSQNAIKKTT